MPLDLLIRMSRFTTLTPRQLGALAGIILGALVVEFFVLESTIESTSSISSVLERNADQDFLLRDGEADGYTTAGDRRELYAQARPRKAG